VSVRFGRERQRLVGEERRTRLAMHEALRGGAAGGAAGVDQQGVAAALDTLLALQQRRLTLLQEEQRELARFLTPAQRAEYLGMQERAMRAAQRFRREREPGMPGRGPGGGPP
jgi:Spy/CpxP family protein refolding chaperone